METPLEGSRLCSSVLIRHLQLQAVNTAGTSLHQGLFFTYNLGKAILLKGVEKTVGVGRRDL